MALGRTGGPADSDWVLATAAEDGVLRARYCISCPGVPGACRWI
jgi:hypothetical protein